MPHVIPFPCGHMWLKMGQDHRLNVAGSVRIRPRAMRHRRRGLLPRSRVEKEGPAEPAMSLYVSGVLSGSAPPAVPQCTPPPPPLPSSRHPPMGTGRSGSRQHSVTCVSVGRFYMLFVLSGTHGRGGTKCRVAACRL